MSAIEATSAPGMDSSLEEQSSLSAADMMAAPPNTPRATAIHLASPTDIPPPPAYKPPALPISPTEKLELKREARCDGIVPPINTPRQSVDSAIRVQRHPRSSDERKRPSAKGATASSSTVVTELDLSMPPKAPARSASLVTSTVRQRVTLRAQPKMATSGARHHRGDAGMP
ncbi:hypothetical protein SYNPS1DRAFT_22614, partial [Syncephalis pseudoplumigaleata]